MLKGMGKGMGMGWVSKNGTIIKRKQSVATFRLRKNELGQVLAK